MTPTLIIFRHGQTDYNASRRFQGQSDVPLNEKGVAQARQAAEIVANIVERATSEGARLGPARTSDLSRAHDTARAVAQAVLARVRRSLSFDPTPALREFDCGGLVVHTVEEYEEKHPGVLGAYFKAYETDRYTARFPGDGETRLDVMARVAELLRGLNQGCGEGLRAPSSGTARRQDAVSAFGASEVHVWSTHGGVIDVLLELCNNALTLEAKPVGNGDVLVLQPAVDYGATAERGARPEAGTVFPNPHVEKLGCRVGWKLWRHYKVGDSTAARIVR